MGCNFPGYTVHTVCKNVNPKGAVWRKCSENKIKIAKKEKTNQNHIKYL